MNEQELQHYGVVGMKWGVRRGNRAKQSAAKAKSSIEKQQDLQTKRITEWNKTARKTGGKTSMSKEERRLYSDYKKNARTARRLGDPTKHYSKAFGKSSDKAMSIDNKATNTRIKSAKLAKKALKKAKTNDVREAYTGNRKAQNKLYKAYKLELKAAKLDKKSEKWVKRMEKEFSNVSINDINEGTLDYGKRYVYMLKR